MINTAVIEGNKPMKVSTQAIFKAIFLLKSEKTTKNWTDDTIMCKRRGCVCSGCKFEQYPCNLKNKVVALVRTQGKPEGVTEPTIYPKPKDELQYLLDRYSKGTVCYILGCSRNKLEVLIKELEVDER